MRCCIWFIAIICFAIVGLPTRPAEAETRVALIIGNSAYQHTARLANPENDVKAVAKVLGDIGFKVIQKVNLDYRELRQAIREFGEHAQQADIALIHFAGHGVEFGGENYLLPVDAKLMRDVDLEYEGVTLTSVLNSTAGARRLRMVVLDACRNNPLRDKMRLSTGATRSAGRGLGRVEPHGDVLIAFSAKAGTVAFDGTGALSPYAAALIKHLPTPGLDVRLLFGRVRDYVLDATQTQQEPFIYGSLKGEIISFVPSTASDLEASQRELARFAEESAKKAKADEAEARRQAEEAAKRRKEAEAEADRARKDAEIAIALADQRRREAVQAKEEAERQQRAAEEERERQRLEEERAMFSFTVCNKSRYEAFIAVQHLSRVTSDWMVEGWWNVAAGQCRDIGRFQRGWFNYFATTKNYQRSWAGRDNIGLCVDLNSNMKRMNTSSYTCSNRETWVKFHQINVTNETFTWNLNN